MKQGVITENLDGSPAEDYLFRVSLKAYIENDKGEVLVVKETGRDWWDLPGGGMNYGDTFESALARELYEEVGFKGKFTSYILRVEEPTRVVRLGVLQVRLVFRVVPDSYEFAPGDDGDEIAWKKPDVFASSENLAEHRVYECSLE